MTAARTPAVGFSAALAVGLAVAALAVWQWRGRIATAPQASMTGATWDHVKEEYPLVAGLPRIPALPADLVDGVARANPFSPQRRNVPSSTTGRGEGGGVEIQQPAVPKFIYKGRVQLGTRQRAIVEETTGGKTYFLELGQEVAGFKVLDIAEKQVVLSELHTNEELVVSLAAPEGAE